MNEDIERVVPERGDRILYELGDWDVDQIRKLSNATNSCKPGDEVPGVIVHVWGETPESACNLKLWLDGPRDYWVTSVQRDASHDIVQYEPGGRWRYHDDPRFEIVERDTEPTATDLLEDAWILIANAHGGDWNNATGEWVAAAERWRKNWHQKLGIHEPVSDEEPSPVG